ncbi:uncharacterized protein FOMMEDRAFT_74919, partial [Fomitiporia mediterranea MF3/22]|uniref:uncharacterized protein n=1 Tax=Fomitiporia mediterranea (strain MF3/22) TaxID=694068 RepID=UPI00044085FD
LIAHLYGLVEGRCADGGMLIDSHLLEKCEQYTIKPEANETTPLKDRFFQLYGDGAYGVSHVLVSPFSNPTPDEQDWNSSMSKYRIEVEHAFGIVLNKWPFLNSFYKHKIYNGPVGRYYRVAVLLTNAHNCFSPNQVSKAFHCYPPSIYQYFHD